MKDLVTFIKGTQTNRNGDSAAEAAWKKMLSKADTKSINNFIKIARTDKEISDDPGIYLLSTVRDYNRNPEIEIYAWDNHKVSVFRFSQEGPDHTIYTNKTLSFIEEIKETNPTKAFFINNKIGYKWCAQIKELAEIE